LQRFSEPQQKYLLPTQQRSACSQLEVLKEMSLQEVSIIRL